MRHNSQRKDKRLFTAEGDGEKIQAFQASDERDEGRWIAGEIEKLHAKGTSYDDIAVFYRTNAQSRILEDKILREAVPYNEAAVQAARQHMAAHTPGCPGSAPKAMHVCPGSMAKALHPAEAGESAPTTAHSVLRQLPVQIKLVPVNSPYYDGARLRIAADCTAYAYAAFHARFIRGHIT